MYRRTISAIMLSLLVVCTLALAFNIQTVKADVEPYFSVEPVAIAPLTNINASINGLEIPSTPSPIGQNFTVYIHLRNATVTDFPLGIRGVEVHFYFGNILTYAVPTGFTNYLGQTGGVLSNLLSLFYGYNGPGFYAADAWTHITEAPYTGAVYYIVAAVGDAWNGVDGLIAAINFTIISQPQQTINGLHTAYLNLVNDFPDLITFNTPSHVYTPYYGNVQGSLTIDVPPKTYQGIGYDYPIYVNVTNDPDPTALIFNATATVFNSTGQWIVNSTNIGPVQSGESVYIRLVWDTSLGAPPNGSPWEPGWYTTNITSYAYPTTPGGEETHNNTYTYATVFLGTAGGFDGDAYVDLLDLVLLAKAYFSNCSGYISPGVISQTGLPPATPTWNSNADINGDGHVSLADLGILAKNYGKSV